MSESKKVAITLEEILIGLETDHGIPFTVGDMATSSDGTNDNISSVCALGNAAVDIIKRAEKDLSVNRVRSVGNIIYEAWNDVLRKKLNIDSSSDYYRDADLWARGQQIFQEIGASHIIDNNDLDNKSFVDNAKNMRELLAQYNIPLDTPIEFTVL